MFQINSFEFKAQLKDERISSTNIMNS